MSSLPQVNVKIPSPLRRFTANQSSMFITAPTVKAVVDELVAQHTGLRKHLFDEMGQLRRFVNIYVRGEDIHYLGGLATNLDDGDEIMIIPSIAGGAGVATSEQAIDQRLSEQPERVALCKPFWVSRPKRSPSMDQLDSLEEKSVYILREAYAKFKNLAMLWSIGKDSTVLLWLTRKAFFGHVEFPLGHIDNSYKVPAMIAYRDKLAKEWRLNMVYGRNKEALQKKQTFPDGALDRISCCRTLKTDALKHTLAGEWPRYRLNHESGEYKKDNNREPYTASSSAPALMRRARAPRSATSHPGRGIAKGTSATNPPEFWNQFKTDFAPGTLKGTALG